MLCTNEEVADGVEIDHVDKGKWSTGEAEEVVGEGKVAMNEGRTEGLPALGCRAEAGNGKQDT